MRTIGVIPARMASTRFPGKVLAKIGDQTMIERVWRKAKAATKLDDVLIACDHDDVLKTAKSFGARAVMTDPNHPSGSDRIAQAISNEVCEIVINIQGDEPFIDTGVIDALAGALQADAKISMGTVIKPIASDEEFLNPNVVKCVIDEQGFALYFSRAPIPYKRDAQSATIKRYKHLGIYAYRKEFLLQYKDWPKSSLENCEQLEQLRVLEKGYRIKTVETHQESIAIDTPADLEKALLWLQKQSN